MFYLHCEGAMIAQGGFYDLYYKAGELHRTKQLRHTMRQLKMDSENVQQSIKLDEIVFEKLKTRGIKTMNEAVHSGAYVNTKICLFNNYEEHLAYWRLRRRVTFLLAKCFECLVHYNIGMYLRFKEKLMTDWPEMLDLSPTDQVALKTAERMQIYYKILCANEPWAQ